MNERNRGGRRAAGLIVGVLVVALIGAGCAEHAAPRRTWTRGFPYGSPRLYPVHVSPIDGRIADRSAAHVPRAAGRCTRVVIRLPRAITFHGDRGPVTANVKTNLAPGEYSVRYQATTRSLVIDPLDTKARVVEVLLVPGDPLVPLYQAYLDSMIAAVPLRVEDSGGIQVTGCDHRCARIEALAPDRALELIARGSLASGPAEQQSWRAWVGVARKLAYRPSADDSLSGREVAELLGNHRALAGMQAAGRPAAAAVHARRVTTEEWRALERWERDLWLAYVQQYGSEPDIGQAQQDIHIDADIALGMALRMVPKHLAPGLRDGFQQLIDDPYFRATVMGAVTLYFAMLVAPEPLITKVTPALTTLGLISLVGFSAVELLSVARAWMHLQDEARAACTLGDLDAAAERFARSLSGTAVRVLVAVFMAHAAKSLPSRPVSGGGGGGPGGLAPATAAVGRGGSAAMAAAPAAALGWGIRIQDGVAVFVLMAMTGPGASKLLGGGLGGSNAATTDSKPAKSKRQQVSGGNTGGGPGRWIQPQPRESMSARAARYQEQITGRPAEYSYEVRGVRFDGHRDGALLEAKGEGYATFIENGRFKRFFQKRDQLLAQARKQSEIARAEGLRIKWHVAEAEFATLLRRLFTEDQLYNIVVKHTPSKP